MKAAASVAFAFVGGASPILGADLHCHAVSASVTDSWCISNCNHIPKNCPAALCKCDTPPTPAPTPAPPGPPPGPPPPPPGPLGKRAIIGYWGSAAELPTTEQLPEALKRGYNVICVAFGDTMGADGSFQIHTNLGDPPTKATVSHQAGVDSKSWQYLLSFGGQNAPGPTPGDEDTYVSVFMKTYHAAQDKFGFDGIDIDIEANMNTALLRALRRIFVQLHSEGQKISMAPQPLNIDTYDAKIFMEGAYNAYVPLVDTTMIHTVSYIATQLYNNALPAGDLETYIQTMQRNDVIDWDGKKLVLNIPSHKLTFGHPAANGAGHFIQGWQSDPAKLAAHYKQSKALMATGGLMTWSIGWDASNGWKWIDAVKTIWPSENSTIVATTWPVLV